MKRNTNPTMEHAGDTQRHLPDTGSLGRPARILFGTNRPAERVPHTGGQERSKRTSSSSSHGGIARAYIPKGDREITFWIGQEGTAIVSLRSYVCNGAGYESVELMEDSSLYRLRRNDLDTLYREDIHIANWGRKSAESEFLRTGGREAHPPAFYDGLGTLPNCC